MTDLAERGFVRLAETVAAPRLLGLCSALEVLRTTANGYGVLSHNLWRRLPAFADLLRSGPLPGLAAALLGVRRVCLFQDNLVWKPPGTRAGLHWHQDYSYWPLAEPVGLTLWLALDDADEQNGCLRYIPGSHLEGERQPADFVRGAHQPGRPDLPPLDWRRRAHEAIAAPVEAGGILAHDPLVWHMSEGNPSARDRRAWSTTWVTEAARWAPDHAAHPYCTVPGSSTRHGQPLAGPHFPSFEVAETGDPA